MSKNKKPPIENLKSYFSSKKQFQDEITMSGFRLDNNLKEVFKELKKNDEIDKSVINNYNFICSERQFKRGVKSLLEEIESDISNKTYVIAENGLKCDFIEIQIKQLMDLAKKTDCLIIEYPEINLDNLLMKIELVSKHINLNFKRARDIRTSDDLIDDIISNGKTINSIPVVPNNDLVKLFDFNYSDAYVTCLNEIRNEIRNVISRIVDSNKYILESKFNLTKSPPFLILREQPQPIETQKPKKKTPKTFDELFYNSNFVNPCIDILKELKHPFIDTDYNYIGKLKGVYCIWINELIKEGIIKRYNDRKIYASLIPSKVKGFSIDESMFGKHHEQAEKLYKIDIKTKISDIKLSQSSQPSQKEN